MVKLVLLIEKNDHIRSDFRNVLLHNKVSVLTASQQEMASHLLVSIIPDLVLINFSLWQERTPEWSHLAQWIYGSRKIPMLVYRQQHCKFGYVLFDYPQVDWRLSLNLPCDKFKHLMLEQLIL